jgi:ABC-type polysaccharide/polyol phosphate export permease
MVGIVESMRWALLGEGTFPTFAFGVSLVAAFMLVASGAFIFRIIEDTAADVV